MNDIEALGLLIVTILGALSSAGLGWADSGTTFDPRKFYPSLIRAAIAAAITFAASYAGFVGTVNVFTYILVFAAGGGFDMFGNRISGIAQTQLATTPTSTSPTATTNTRFKVRFKRLFFIILPYIV
jgi:hypothetical protein